MPPSLLVSVRLLPVTAWSPPTVMWPLAVLVTSLPEMVSFSVTAMPPSLLVSVRVLPVTVWLPPTVMSSLAVLVTSLPEMVSFLVTAMPPSLLVSARVLSVTSRLPPTVMLPLAFLVTVLPPVTVSLPVTWMVPASMSTLPPSVTVRASVLTVPGACTCKVLSLPVTVMVLSSTLPGLVAVGSLLVRMDAVPPFLTVRVLSAAVTLPSAVSSFQVTPSTTMLPSRLVSPWSM